MISPLVWLALGAAALYHVTTQKDRTRTSGTVLLRAHVPYEVVLYWPKATGTPDVTDTKQVTAFAEKLVALGGTFPGITETPAGATIVARIVPPTPLPLTFGTATVGPAIVRSATRLDGKDWNYP